MTSAIVLQHSDMAIGRLAFRPPRLRGFACGRLLCAAAALWAGFFASPVTGQVPHGNAKESPAPAARPWQVVILNDADPTLPSYVAMDRALRAALGAPGRHSVDTFFETLDTLRFSGARLEDELVALLAKKYGSMHVDAVVAIGTASLDFVEEHRDRLWPNARVVFSGVPDELLRKRQLAPGTTGVLRRYEIAGTVDLALRLRPETRRLIVIHGSGDFDRIMGGLARSQLQPMAGRLTVEYWTDASIGEFLRRMAQLDRNDAVLYLSIGRDADGRTFVPREVLKQLSAASPAPIYGPIETFIGFGIVAGSVYTFEDRGRRMGELVHEVLALPPGQTPPQAAAGVPTCMADANALARFDLNGGRLPTGCDIRFAQPNVVHQYRWHIAAALTLLLLQSALIAALMLQRRRRVQAEVESAHRGAELAQASRLALAGELTASIAHEINQPLGAILANAGAAEALLRRGATSSDEFRAIIADIKEQDLRAGEVIRRVRALVTTHQAEREPADLNAIVNDVVGFVRGEALRRGVVIDTALASGLPELLVDRVQLQQAIVNLCVNAMDAMQDTVAGTRQLGVRTRALADGGVEVAVRDSGPGIPPAQLPHLFESFFTTKTHGTGLGLSITRSIVEAHGGKLLAENDDDGGALFRIVLPARHEQDAAHGGVVRYATVPAADAQTAAMLSKESS